MNTEECLEKLERGLRCYRNMTIRLALVLVGVMTIAAPDAQGEKDAKEDAFASVDSINKAIMIFIRSLDNFRQKEYDDAKVNMLRAWKLCPQNGRVAYYLGTICNELGSYQEATGWYRKWGELGSPQRTKTEKDFLRGELGTEEFQKTKPPKLVKWGPLVYPEAERRVAEEGVVYVRFVVGVDGKTSNPVVMKIEGSESFRKPAVACIVQSVYEPAVWNGMGIPVNVVVPVRFNLATGSKEEAEVQ